MRLIRTGQVLGLAMLDVDHFPSFNEEEGHDAGDEVLKIVADAIKSCLRPYDLAARYGGEEFTIIMPGSGREGTEAVAERIRSRIEAAGYVTKSWSRSPRHGKRRLCDLSRCCSGRPHSAESGRCRFIRSKAEGPQSGDIQRRRRRLSPSSLHDFNGGNRQVAASQRQRRGSSKA